MSPATAKFILTKIMGWTLDESPIADPKCVIVGFPHTCIEDFFVYALYMRALGERATVMMKKEFFVWPLSILLNHWGVIRTDRSRGAGALKHCIDEFSRRDVLKLSLSPEGTRKAVKNWKTGFHIIAREAGVPVYLGYYDWAHKYITHGVPFPLTDNSREDIRRIQQFYKSSPASAKYPDRVAYMDGI